MVIPPTHTHKEKRNQAGAPSPKRDKTLLVPPPPKAAPPAPPAPSPWTSKKA